MRATISVLLLTVTFLDLVYSARENYDDHQVFDVKPETNEQVKALKGLLTLTDDNGEGIFVRKNFRLNFSSFVVVHPKSLQQYSDLVTAMEIKSIKKTINVTAEWEKIPEPTAYYQNGGIPWENYQSIDVLDEWFEHVGNGFPTVAKLETIGETSGDGGKKRKIQLFSISLKLEANPKPPGVFILAGTIPENSETTAVACFIINELTKNREMYTHLLESRIFYVLPLYNPDGLEYLQRTGIFTAKNRSKPKTADGKCPGVNLAYNFDYQWNTELTETDVVEKQQCSPYFSGDAPCSEEECKAVSKFILEHKNVDTFFDILQNTQSWLYPPAGKLDQNPGGDYLRMVSMKAAQEIVNFENAAYAVDRISNYETEVRGGMGVDWAYEVAKIKNAFMVNPRDPGNYAALFLPPSELKYTALEVWTGIQATMTHQASQKSGSRAVGGVQGMRELIIFWGALVTKATLKV